MVKNDDAFVAILDDRIDLECTDEKNTLKTRLKAWDGEGISDRECIYGQPVGKEIW